MSIRVMIVDDDALIRRTLSSALARGGFHVSTANDGLSGLKLANVDTPDIAIIDLNMPLGGLEVARQLKASYGDTMFVAMLTGDDDDLTHELCLEAGADAVLVKPMSPADLRRRLATAANGLKKLFPVAS
ncbi:MAG TPA: response regulator transcription factor [Kofleriaceae bacterium]